MLRFSRNIFVLFTILLSFSCEKEKENVKIWINTTAIDSLYTLAKYNKNDSLLNEALKKQIKFHYKKKNWEQFNIYRFEHLSLTKKIQDTFAHAKTLEYSGTYFKLIDKPDSAYYYYQKSFKNYLFLKDSLRSGSVLLNKAIIQKNVRDYRGSEITSFKALDFLLVANNQRRIASVYNNLGILYNQLNDKELAIKFHTLAKDIRETITDKPILALHSINNIGKVFSDNNMYNKAIENYQRLLNDSLLASIPKFHAIVIDNSAYAYFKKGDIDKTEFEFKKALSIRDSIRDLNGSIINCIHLAEYYLKKQDTLIALTYAQRAELLSQKTHNYRDYLRALHLLSGLYPKDKAVDHFNKYIAIRDSLDKVRLSYEKSFERIEFEINQKEAIISDQNEEITAKSQVLFVIIVLVLLVTTVIIYVIQKKKKKLRILQDKAATGFRNYLVDKYSLTPENIKFWELWKTGISQKEVSELLFITIDAVDSRRKSLRKKINKIQKIEGNFDQALAIIFYNNEKEIYASVSSNSKSNFF